MLNRPILLRRKPPNPLRILIPNAMTPRQILIHLNKVIIPQHRILRLHAAEEIHHALLELVLEAGDVARGVNLTEGHAELVGEAPETREQDRAGEEVVLAIGLFEHDGEVVLDETGGDGHGVFFEGPLDDVEGFACGEVVDADGGLLEEGGVALREVGAEFFEELDGAVEGFGRGAAAFGAAGGDAACFVVVVAHVMVVELDPFVPVHVA